MTGLEELDIALVRADNPGPFTLSGTNTWLVGRDPCWVIDPGPALESHVSAVLDAAGARGGVGGIALTHDHHDHSEAIPLLRDATGAPVAGACAGCSLPLRDGEGFGPLVAVALPGHARDHVGFVFRDRVAFTGDAVLGEGSVFIIGDLGPYLAALMALRDRDLELLCPGHGPVIEDPRAKLDGYLAHRLDRERRLVEALDAGLRGVDELLDRVWDDAPQVLRPAAAVTLGAHLDKLEEEGRLPGGVERPEIPAGLRGP